MPDFNCPLLLLALMLGIVASASADELDTLIYKMRGITPPPLEASASAPAAIPLKTPVPKSVANTFPDESQAFRLQDKMLGTADSETSTPSSSEVLNVPKLAPASTLPPLNTPPFSTPPPAALPPVYAPPPAALPPSHSSR